MHCEHLIINYNVCVCVATSYGYGLQGQTTIFHQIEMSTEIGLYTSPTTACLDSCTRTRKTAADLLFALYSLRSTEHRTLKRATASHTLFRMESIIFHHHAHTNTHIVN